MQQLALVKSKSKGKNKIKVINRDRIPALKTIEVDGVKHNLGLLLDFRKQKDLAEFMPETGRFSVSWTRLKKGEELSTHKHPTPSLIIIVEGTGKIMGDMKCNLRAGDMALVPPNCAHGFVGTGDGFWALSVQFEGSGLYENRGKPRVKFGGKEGFEDTFEDLMADQKKYEKHFLQNPLMKLVRSDQIKNKEVKERLLKALNYWSNWFQKILAARVAVGAPQIFQSSSEHHFGEEVGHNDSLYVIRNRQSPDLWEPTLDMSASWFYQRMITGRPATRAVLMHCVCESASYIFHTEAKKVFSDLSHFALHSDLDSEHAREGFDLIKEIPGLDLHEMRIVLKRGWDVFEQLATGMANYAKYGDYESKRKK
jgi:quercetin dioxygenase-like cupin family protein